MQEMDESAVYAVVGEAGFRRICAEFYQQIPTDEILGPMYPADDLVGAEERLAGFLIYRFGGPPTYIEQRGHPRLRMRHMPFVIDQTARDRWMELMTKAIKQAGISNSAAETLLRFFEHMSTFLVNKQEQQ